jgi:hypothetical protein
MTFTPADYIARVLSPAVEAFAREGRLPDLFERYDLPLDASGSAAIEGQIKTVVSFWNKTKANPKYTAFLQVLLSPKEQADSQDLLDATARTALRKLVEAERKKVVASRFAALDEAIKRISGKGHMTAAECALLVKRFRSGTLDEKAILSRIKVPFGEMKVLLPDESQCLPQAVRKQIRNSLNVLGSSNLYDFLELAPGAARAAVARAWAALDERWRAKGADFKKTAAQELLGIVKAHLIDGDPRRYEASLRWELVEKLDEELGLAAADGQVDEREFAALVGFATGLGLEVAVARDYIVGLAQRRKVAVAVPPPENEILCGNCGAAQPRAGRDECAVCHHALWSPCPKCRTRLASGDTRCGNCGFRLENQHQAELAMRRAEIAIDERRWADALVAARRVQELDWLSPSEARSLVERALAGQRELDDLRKKVDAEIVAKRLHAAHRLAVGLVARAGDHRFVDGKTLAELVMELERRLKSAATHVAEGLAHERAGRSRDSVFSYQAALAVAADDVEARKGLARCPPEPPTSARVGLAGGAVSVEWSRSPAAGDLRYLVVRSTGRPAALPEEGVEVARTTDLACTDQGAGAGLTVFYSVFTDRGGTLSPPVKTEAVLVAQEIRGLVLEPGNRAVRGVWALATGAQARVRVWRGEDRPPSRAGEGVEIRAAGPTSFVDGDLTNGTTYYYRVAVEYLDAAGRVVFTPGLVASAMPVEPPPPIRDLRLVSDPPGLLVAFPPPARGVPSIHRVTRPSPWEAGTQVRISQLSTLGPALPLRASPPGAVDAAPAPGRTWYVPATVIGDLAVIGEALPFVSVPDVTRVTGENFGSYLLVRWAWPQESRQARVAWRHDQMPTGPHDPMAEARNITHAKYDEEGAFKIREPANRRHHIAVFAGVEVDGKLSFGPALGRDTRVIVAAQPVRVRYSVRKKLFSKTLVVTFEADEDIAELPAVALVASEEGLQPIRANPGTTLQTFRGLRLAARVPSVCEVSLGSGPSLVVRAMFEEAGLTHGYQLIDPAPSELRVRR